MVELILSTPPCETFIAMRAGDVNRFLGHMVTTNHPVAASPGTRGAA